MRCKYVFALLAVASTVCLWLHGAGFVLPSVLRDPLFNFIQPGVSLWWICLGGVFAATPTTAPGMAFAVLANTVAWQAAFCFLAMLLRRLRRLLAARQS